MYMKFQHLQNYLEWGHPLRQSSKPELTFLFYLTVDPHPVSQAKPDHFMNSDNVPLLFKYNFGKTHDLEWKTLLMLPLLLNQLWYSGEINSPELPMWFSPYLCTCSLAQAVPLHRRVSSHLNMLKSQVSFNVQITHHLNLKSFFPFSW